MEKLFLLDAYALIFRAYYAFISKPMRNQAGLNTSAIFGFTKFLRDIIVRERPQHLGVAFDPRGGNFRHQLYPLYKANRKDTPEDIVESVPWIKQLLEAMCIPILEVAGWEADDVIGTISVKASAAGYATFMVTPDKDYGQLVTDRAVIYKQRSGEGIEIVDRQAIKAAYGVDDPRLVADILALWGDASDNVPGVPGIGEKGASKLVAEWGSVENILEHAKSGKIGGRAGANIVANSAQLLMAKRLVTIDTEVPIELDIESLVMCDPDTERLRKIFNELNFSMFLREIDSDRRSPFVTSAMAGSGGGQIAGNNAESSAGDLFSAAGNSGGTGAQTTVNKQVTSTPDLFTPSWQVEAQAAAPDLFSSAPALATLATTPHEYRTLLEDSELRELVDTFSRLPEFAYDTETTGYDCFGDRMIGLSMCAEAGRAFWIPLDRKTEKQRLEILRPLFENPAIVKIGQNMKFDNEFMREAGIEVRGPKIDTMLVHYLLDPEARHNMNYLANKYLDYDPIPIASLIGSGVRVMTMDMVAPDRVAEYAAEDADVTLRLKHVLWPQIAENQSLKRLYEEIEEPLVDVLADMERQGVRIDSAALAESAVELRGRLEALDSEIREITGENSLNINSAKQLGDVLFGKMKLVDKPKMTKTRQFSTDEETLQSLAGKHPVVGKILEYRGTKKLLSTYVEALPELVNPHTGRIHTSYNQAVTATGRLSSTNPNLQNIPIRDEQGRAIRRAFIPSSADRILLSADYSQVELRIMAHLSGDEALIGAFRNGEDIHSATAARIFGVPLSSVTPEQRRRAKTANFGIIYGISAFGLSQRLAIPRAEASDIIAGYFRSYPGVHDYMMRVQADARGNGWVETIFGRRRYLPDINSRNATIRALAERNAVNAPIQGSAADIMKIAMIRIFNDLRSAGLESRMILQVHDEVVVDTLRTERDAVESIVRRAMQGAADLAVELLVEVGTGENWLDAH